MTIRCFPSRWGGAHACDHPGCDAHSPIKGAVDRPLDACELQAAAIDCPRNGSCTAAVIGWHIGKTPEDPDYCPEHKP